MRLVAAAPRTDTDECEPVGAGDRLADLVEVEAKERADPDRDLLTVDPPHARATDDGVHLFLTGLELVVLDALGARRQVEQVDPERLDLEPASNEPNCAGPAFALDLICLDDAVTHTAHFYQPSTISVMVIGKLLCPLLLAAALFLAAGTAADARQVGSCSTQGLKFTAGAKTSYKVLALQAQGFGCSKARTIATQVAKELLHGRPITLTGVHGFAMSTSTCTGCAPTTQVSLSYASGTVKVTLTGSGKSAPSSGGQVPVPPVIPPTSGPTITA